MITPESFICLIYELPPPLGLEDDSNTPSEKEEFDDTEVMMCPDSNRMITKKQIKIAYEKYNIPIIMGGIKKVHYMDAFRKVCKNVLKVKYSAEEISSSRIDTLDKVLDDMWFRKFPEYKLSYEKHRNEPFQITLPMYFLFKFVMKTFETEKEKK